MTTVCSDRVFLSAVVYILYCALPISTSCYLYPMSSFNPFQASRSSRSSSYVPRTPSSFKMPTVQDSEDNRTRLSYHTTTTAAPTESTGVIQHLTSMPITLSVVTIIYVLTAPIAALMPAPFGEGTGHFMVKQLSVNSSLLIILSMLYGMLVLAYPSTWIARYQNLVLPLCLIVVLWFKCFITYQQGLKNYCIEQAEQDGGVYNADGGAPYSTNSLLWNTAKVPIAIFVVYIFVILFPQTFTPFFQFFSGDEEPHKLILYFAIGFWTGCAAWASEASCYFQMMRSGCRPYDNIKFETVAQVIASANN